MFGFLSFFLENILFFALHFENCGVFPKPLSAKQEEECFELMTIQRTHALRLTLHDALRMRY